MINFIIWLHIIFSVSGNNFFQQALLFHCPFFSKEEVKKIHENILNSCEDTPDFHFGLSQSLIDRITEKESTNCIHFIKQITSYSLSLRAFEPSIASRLKKVFIRLFLSMRSFRVELNILNYILELKHLLEFDTNESNFYCPTYYPILFAIFDRILFHASMFETIPFEARKRILEIRYFIDLRCKTDFGTEIDNLILPMLKLKRIKFTGPPIPLNTENTIILATWERYSRLLVMKKDKHLLYNLRISPQANLRYIVHFLTELKKKDSQVDLFDLLEPCYLCDYLNSLSYLHFQKDKEMRENIFNLKKLIISLLEQIGMRQMKIST
jgi:hypothetical protein